MGDRARARRAARVACDVTVWILACVAKQCAARAREAGAARARARGVEAWARRVVDAFARGFRGCARGLAAVSSAERARMARAWRSRRATRARARFYGRECARAMRGRGRARRAFSLDARENASSKNARTQPRAHRRDRESRARRARRMRARTAHRLEPAPPSRDRESRVRTRDARAPSAVARAKPIAQREISRVRAPARVSRPRRARRGAHHSPTSPSTNPNPARAPTRERGAGSANRERTRSRRHTPTRDRSRRAPTPRRDRDRATRTTARHPIPRARTASRDRDRRDRATTASIVVGQFAKVPTTTTTTTFDDDDDDAREMSIAAHARFKDGTIKHACFAALYAAGAAGLTVRPRARAGIRNHPSEP